MGVRFILTATAPMHTHASDWRLCLKRTLLTCEEINCAACIKLRARMMDAVNGRLEAQFKSTDKTNQVLDEMETQNGECG